jgi:hypothetical protein
MSVKSRVNASDRVVNTEHTIGEAEYYTLAYYVDKDGNESPMAMTDNEVKVMRARALKQDEDFSAQRSFLSKFFFG